MGLSLGTNLLAAVTLENRGDVTSEFDRLGLRSSSDKDRLIGNDGGTPGRWRELFRGVAGPGLFECTEPSEDHAGTGGLFGFGDSASFLDGWGLCWLLYCWGADQSLDCWGIC